MTGGPLLLGTISIDLAVISYFLQIFLKINSNFDFPTKVSRNISTVLSQSLYALLGGVE